MHETPFKAPEQKLAGKLGSAQNRERSNFREIPHTRKHGSQIQFKKYQKKISLSSFQKLSPSLCTFLLLGSLKYHFVLFRQHINFNNLPSVTEDINQTADETNPVAQLHLRQTPARSNVQDVKFSTPCCLHHSCGVLQSARQTLLRGKILQLAILFQTNSSHRYVQTNIFQPLVAIAVD